MLFSFGYTFCPDVCPVTLSTWSKVRGSLGDNAGQVTFVFVTVDPERDSAERLRRQMEIFDSSFVALGGQLEELESVYEAYGIYRNKL